MKNLRKLNPLVYWVIMSVWITLKTILTILEAIAEPCILLGAFVLSCAFPPLGIVLVLLWLCKRERKENV